MKLELACANDQTGALYIGWQDTQLVLASEKADGHTRVQHGRVNGFVMPCEVELLDDPLRLLFHEWPDDGQSHARAR